MIGVSERLRDDGFIRLVHPPDLPDLTPPDFFALGSLREQLKESAYSAPNELEHAIVGTKEAIPRETLLDISSTWRRRLESCIERDGDYFEYPAHTSHPFHGLDVFWFGTLKVFKKYRVKDAAEDWQVDHMLGILRASEAVATNMTIRGS
jgi:hypothetical protein